MGAIETPPLLFLSHSIQGCCFLQGSGRGRDESERVKASEATGPVYIVLLWTLNIQPTPE